MDKTLGTIFFTFLFSFFLAGAIFAYTVGNYHKKKAIEFGCGEYDAATGKFFYRREGDE